MLGFSPVCDLKSVGRAWIWGQVITADTVDCWRIVEGLLKNSFYLLFVENTPIICCLLKIHLLFVVENYSWQTWAVDNSRKKQILWTSGKWEESELGMSSIWTISIVISIVVFLYRVASHLCISQFPGQKKLQRGGWWTRSFLIRKFCCRFLVLKTVTSVMNFLKKLQRGLGGGGQRPFGVVPED